MQSNKNYVIALDGPAGSGKSSVATILAKKLGCIHADSGAMYRTLTLAVIQKIGACKNPEKFGDEFSKQHKINPQELNASVDLDSGGQQVNLINNEDVGEKIRTVDVTARIRYIADLREFRDQVNLMLRNLAEKTSIVADGRDMGSVVFKDTPYQFYLDASVEIRAKRRLLEMEEKSLLNGITLDQLKNQIQKRDHEDKNREFGALVQAPKAILIDTSSMNRNDVVQLLLTQLQQKF